ncbi:MAG: lipoprotein signal peptidase [Prevotellaceae bacterium]|jgi:signal peptidase II|nr:lipoprotein signal peptidase [Prevotellaceae bacterium]
MSLKNKAFLFIGLILIADQALKIWVKTHMGLDERIRIFGDWFYIHFTENPGMAFGMTFGGPTGKILLVTFRIMMAAVILWYIPKMIQRGAGTGLIMSVAGICAGALGNIIDCAFYGLIFDTGTVFSPGFDQYVGYAGVSQFAPEGYSSFMHGCVVDMFHFPIIQTSYPEWFPLRGGEEFVFFRPIFNVADSAISVSIIYIILFQRKTLNIAMGVKEKSKSKS